MYVQDELLWSASWLLLVTGNSSYSQYAEMNIEHIKEDGKEHLFNWNDKTLGIKVLLAKLFISYFNFHLTCEGIVAYQSFLLLFLAVNLAKYFCSLFPTFSISQSRHIPGCCIILFLLLRWVL